ncbi:MAG TPA: hypothetical protein VN238_15885 [Solirubrobacteraceae bacterium]|nr:hypothetical protein [Solirubrobacteraceae bacterium]
MNLRPLGIGELLDAAFKVCTANFGTLLRVVLFVVVPVQLLSVVILASTMPDDWSANSFDLSGTDGEELTDDELVTLFVGQGVFLVIVLVMQVFATAACFRAIAQAWLGGEADWRESLKFALRRTPALLWVTFLYFLAVVVGFVLCIAPGIWLSILFGLATPVVLVESIGGPGALRRSAKLVKDRWWATFAVIALGYLFAGLLASIMQALVSLPLFFAVDDTSVAAYVINALGQGLGYLIALPFQAAIVAVVYFDLRVRKEGLDLQLMADQIGTQAPAGSSPSWGGSDANAAFGQPSSATWGSPGAASWPAAPTDGDGARNGPEAPESPGGGWLPPEPGR